MLNAETQCISGLKSFSLTQTSFHLFFNDEQTSAKEAIKIYISGSLRCFVFVFVRYVYLLYFN